MPSIASVVSSLCKTDYCVQTLLWGATLTKKYYDLIPINHVLVELDCAGVTERMKNPAQNIRQHLNFPQPGLSLTVVVCAEIEGYMHTQCK